MSGRSASILADPHGGASPEANRALIDLLALAASARADLLILGDLFLAWLGPARFWTPLQREVLGRLEAAKRGGARIAFVVGNRDYLVREALLGSVFDAVHEDETLLDVGGVPTLVTHGDRLNPRDLAYRAWRRVSRSVPAKALLAALPSRVGQALTARTERALAGTNRRYKSGDLPIPALEALGRRAHDRGARRALVGHFHHDRTVEVASGVPVIVAPAWLEHRRILRPTSSGELESVPFAALR